MKRNIKLFFLFLMVAGMFCDCGVGGVKEVEVIDRGKSLDENITENRAGEILIETTPGAKVKVGQLEHERRTSAKDYEPMSPQAKENA